MTHTPGGPPSPVERKVAAGRTEQPAAAGAAVPREPAPNLVFLMCHREARRGDDAGDSAGDLAAALEAAGFDVTWSTSPIDSKRHAEDGQLHPAVVVLDPLVCTADGIEFEMVARMQPDESPLPLIVLLEDRSELAEIGKVQARFKDFLVRPFDREELVQRVQQLVAAKQSWRSLQSHARQLEGQVIRDSKTGLYTERHFAHLLSQEFQRAQRHRTPLSFLLIDIDDFKRVNDDHDYEFGDFVLVHFAELLDHSIRDIDHASRFGGDEFMVLLPNTSPAEAVQVAGRFRNHLERRIFDNSKHRSRVTISIGIDTYDGRGVSSPEELRHRANLALKEAKTRGKNKIWLYSGPPASITGRRGPSGAPERDRAVGDQQS